MRLLFPPPDLFLTPDGAPFVEGDADPSTKGDLELIASLIWIEDHTWVFRMPVLELNEGVF